MEKTKVKKRYTLFTGKQLLWLILPIVIEQIFSTSLGLFDSLMVSNMNAPEAVRSNASNAIGNVDYINNLIIQLFSAFATGGAIVTSQFLGAGDIDGANRSAKQMLMLVICISTVIGGLCLALNWPLLKLFYMEVDETTFSFQQTYFYVTAASFPFIGLFNACAALLRAQRKSFVTMASAAMSCVVNVGLDALFLFVFKMGVLGAALATLFCRAAPAIFMLVLLGSRKNTVCVRVFEKFSFDGKLIKRILKIAIPSGVESALFQLGKLLTKTFLNVGVYSSGAKSVVQVTEKGETVYVNVEANGNTIANQINNFASVAGGGVGTSCLTVIGQAVGAGDPDQVKYYMKRMFLLSYIVNAVCVGVILSLVPFISQMYGYRPEAKTIGEQCLYFCLAFQFVTYPLSFTTPGILKATSDVKYVMYCAVISMFVMRVGLAYILTTDDIPGLPQMGAMGYWIGMCSDWVLRSLLFFSRLLSGRWKRASGLIRETARPSGSGGDGSSDGADDLPTEEADMLKSVETGEGSDLNGSREIKADGDIPQSEEYGENGQDDQSFESEEKDRSIENDKDAATDKSADGEGE